MTFLYLTCPSCKVKIDATHHPEIKSLIDEGSKLEDDVTKQAVERAKMQGIDKDERLKKVGDDYYGNLPKYAMARLSYY